MVKEERKVGKREQWTKRCPRCVERWRDLLSRLDEDTEEANVLGGPDHAELHAHYMPDEYEMCDSCLSGEYDLATTYDALDHLGMEPLCTEVSAIRAIRWALGERYVRL